MPLKTVDELLESVDWGILEAWLEEAKAMSVRVPDYIVAKGLYLMERNDDLIRGLRGFAALMFIGGLRLSDRWVGPDGEQKPEPAEEVEG